MFHLKQRKTPYYANLPLCDILPALHQPRHYFESLRLDELSRSIKKYGILQPILVRTLGKKYEIVAGERRIRAAGIAGLKTIPAIVCTMSDSEALVCALLENTQRENLTFLDESDCYCKLAEQNKFNVASVAYAVCASDDKIEEKMRFKRFSPTLRRLIAYHRISEEHARLILRLGSDEIRTKVLKKITENGYDVSQTSELVEKILIGEIPVISPKKKYGNGDLRPFKNTLKQTVSIMRRSGMKTTVKEQDNEGFYEYTIRVEKAK